MLWVIVPEKMAGQETTGVGQERAEWNAHELQSNPGEIGSSLSDLKIATFLGFMEPSHN
jgi:hypothetical protein